jgi:predicted Zn-dependent protease
MGYKLHLAAAATRLHPTPEVAQQNAPVVRNSCRTSSNRLFVMVMTLALVALGLAAVIMLVPEHNGLFNNHAVTSLAYEKYLPIGSRQLNVAIVLLKPSPVVLKAAKAENTARVAAAAALTSTEGLQALSKDLGKLYPFTYQVVEPIELPDKYFDFQRKQYRIDQLLDWLVQRHDQRYFRTIAVLPVDVYEPGYNFLFGLAKLYGPACISSAARMSQKLAQGRSTPEQRWYGIVRHEFGHALGLQHISARSVMRYSDSLAGLDTESTELTAAEWDRLKMLHPVKWQFE